MSTDDKWLDIGSILKEFNEHAPYSLEHRRMVFLQLSPEQVEQISTPVLGEVAREEIKRLLKPLPHTD